MNTDKLWQKTRDIALLVIAVIFVISMTTSCSTAPTTPRLPEPETPDFPKFTADELAALAQCTKGKQMCTVPRSVILKFDDKVLLYRGYARQLRAVIRANNRSAD